MNHKTIGKLLRKARENNSLTQLALSKKFHLTSAQFISNIERGKCSVPDKDIVRYCGYVNFNVHKLISLKTEAYKTHLTKLALRK